MGGSVVRKIVAGLFISLDGVFEAPHEWHFPYFNDEMGAEVDAQVQASDTLLLGRRTFEEFASFWPNQSEGEPFTRFINSTPKYVVSTTLKSTDWQNSHIISGNVAEKIRRGKNISMSGSLTLVRWLLEQGLLDELRLLVHPIVVGSGTRLFVEGEPTVPLQLMNVQTFSTGVLNLTYGPADT